MIRSTVHVVSSLSAWSGMVMLWYCSGNALVLLWYCSGNALVLLFAAEPELDARPEAWGYKEQEKGQEVLVSLWCMLGSAWHAFFALRLARARRVAG